MEKQQGSAEASWQEAVESGELGLWDLRLELETVHYSPQWKARLGFPDPHAADSTHFWRCRVHPEDLDDMLRAILAHLEGRQPGYEASFRLRSNGSGYRLVHSRGRVIERGAQGQALRMVGTMIDLSDSPCIPRDGLPEGPRDGLEASPLALPFHRLLSDAASAPMPRERERVLGLVRDMLDASVAELESRRSR